MSIFNLRIDPNYGGPERRAGKTRIQTDNGKKVA